MQGDPAAVAPEVVVEVLLLEEGAEEATGATDEATGATDDAAAADVATTGESVVTGAAVATVAKTPPG